VKTEYTVEILRAGQPRAYADTENEYLITCRQDWKGDGVFKPWLLGGNVEARIKREEADRAAGRMSGGMSPDALRKEQQDWVRKIIRVLCQDFREKADQDGREGMAAAFYPTLRRLTVDPVAGTIRVLIVSAYTD